MSVDIRLIPKTKRAAGERCCEPVVYPDVQREHAARIATVAKALGDPIRLQLVDVLRLHAGKGLRLRTRPAVRSVAVNDLAPPKVLRQAGIVGSEHQGLWAYYYVRPDALKELSAWLNRSPGSAPASPRPAARPGDVASDCCHHIDGRLRTGPPTTHPEQRN